MIAQSERRRTWVQALEEACVRRGRRLPAPSRVSMNAIVWRDSTRDRSVTLRIGLLPVEASIGRPVTLGFWDGQDDARPILLVHHDQIPDDRLVERAAGLVLEWLGKDVAVNEFIARHGSASDDSGRRAPPKSTTFGDPSEVSIEITSDSWRMRIGGRSVTRHRHDRLSDWLPRSELELLCGWITAHWQAVAFGADVRPSLIREGNVSACRALSEASPWLQADPQCKASLDEWAARHSVRAASARLPNIFLERMADDLVFSWNSEPAEGRTWDIHYGAHLIPASFGVPLLRDVCRHVASGVDPSARSKHPSAPPMPDWAEAIETLRGYHASESLTEGWLGNAGFGHRQLSEFANSGTSRHPVVGLLRSSRATHITLDEVGCILKRLQPADRTTWTEIRALAEGLDRSIDPREPWASGYDLALAIRSRLNVATGELVDLDAALRRLGVECVPIEIGDPDIRGACVGAPAYRPLIAVNPSSEWANGPSGRRTTIAHELCHLLFDRSMMRGLARFEGSVADTDRHVEMRANAFSIEFLIPRHELIKPNREIVSDDELTALSMRFQVSLHALHWHVANFRRSRPG